VLDRRAVFCPSTKAPLGRSRARATASVRQRGTHARSGRAGARTPTAPETAASRLQSSGHTVVSAGAPLVQSASQARTSSDARIARASGRVGGVQPTQLVAAAQACRKVDDGRMGATAIETASVPMTDLVGSTAMADRLGPTAAEGIRQEPFGPLRGALQCTGGRGVKSLGDGLLVAFSSAFESLACPVQRYRGSAMRIGESVNPISRIASLSRGLDSTT
jgi:hypothetical protein